MNLRTGPTPLSETLGHLSVGSPCECTELVHGSRQTCSNTQLPSGQNQDRKRLELVRALVDVSQIVVEGFEQQPDIGTPLSNKQT